MKIFELRTLDGEKEWIAADTNIEALMHYFSHQQLDISDLNKSDEIVEVPESEWANHKVTNSDYDSCDPNDWQEKTFEEFMKDCHSPEIISGTMY